MPDDPFFPALIAPADDTAGFRFGAVGTHSSRTLMLAELSTLLAVAPVASQRAVYAHQIVDENCLGKQTAATQKLTLQRLTELYGLSQEVPLFRMLDRLWRTASAARPILALFVGLARDPLLRSTAPAIVATPAGSDFPRAVVTEALRSLSAGRLNDSILEKVVRNCASSWTQAGYFDGRTFKRRLKVKPDHASVALALALGHLAGFRGAPLFSSPWVALLDIEPPEARQLALEAKRHGLLDLRISGDVVNIDFSRLDPIFNQHV